jgi:hypothetical protein
METLNNPNTEHLLRFPLPSQHTPSVCPGHWHCHICPARRHALQALQDTPSVSPTGLPHAESHPRNYIYLAHAAGHLGVTLNDAVQCCNEDGIKCTNGRAASISWTGHRHTSDSRFPESVTMLEELTYLHLSDFNIHPAFNHKTERFDTPCNAAESDRAFA